MRLRHRELNINEGRFAAPLGINTKGRLGQAASSKSENSMVRGLTTFDLDRMVLQLERRTTQSLRPFVPSARRVRSQASRCLFTSSLTPAQLEKEPLKQLDREDVVAGCRKVAL